MKVFFLYIYEDIIKTSVKDKTQQYIQEKNVCAVFHSISSCLVRGSQTGEYCIVGDGCVHLIILVGQMGFNQHKANS